MCMDLTAPSAGPPLRPTVESPPPQGPPEVEATRIEEVSPEGRPADPKLRGRHLATFMAIVVVIIAVAGLIVAISASWTAGLVVLFLGLGLGVVMNPEIWATRARAIERNELDHPEERRP